MWVVGDREVQSLEFVHMVDNLCLATDTFVRCSQKLH